MPICGEGRGGVREGVKLPSSKFHKYTHALKHHYENKHAVRCSCLTKCQEVLPDNVARSGPSPNQLRVSTE